MELFFYNKIGSIISIGDLPTTNIIEPNKKEPNINTYQYTINRLKFSPQSIFLSDFRKEFFLS